MEKYNSKPMKDIPLNDFNFSADKFKISFKTLISMKPIQSKQQMIHFCLIISTFPDNEFRKILNYSRITVRCWEILKTIYPFSIILKEYQDREILNDYKNIIYLDIVKRFGTDIVLQYFEQNYNLFTEVRKISDVQNILLDKIPRNLSKEIAMTRCKTDKRNNPVHETEFIQIFNKKGHYNQIIVIDHNSPQVKISKISKIVSYLNSNELNRIFSLKNGCLNLLFSLFLSKIQNGFSNRNFLSSFFDNSVSLPINPSHLNFIRRFNICKDNFYLDFSETFYFYLEKVNQIQSYSNKKFTIYKNLSFDLEDYNSYMQFPAEYNCNL